LLELIFQGLIEWLYGLVLEAWEYFSSALLDIMSMDFVYLESHIAVLPTIQQSMLAVGWALLLGNLIFQAAKSMMSGLGFEGEDPKLLFTRTFVFSFLLLASPQICELCLDMTSRIMEIMEMPTAITITFAEESVFAGLKCAWLLVVICGIIVMFQSFKLIIEMAERYFILAMLTITAPLAFGMGGSRNTSDIFSGWCRMYGSMCLLMVLNIVFVKLLLSVLSFVPTGLDVLPWMILVLTIVKVAKKADAIVTRIGLNPAITGDSLGRSFPGMLTYMVARTAVSQAAKTIGKGGGNGRQGSNGGRNPVTPPGGAGGGKTAGYAGPRSAKHSGAKDSDSNANSQNNTYQSTSRQTSTQHESPKQSTTAQFGGQQTTMKEQSAGTSVMNSSQTLQGGSFSTQTGQTRKTAVPSGVRRSPTHIKTPTPSAGSIGRPKSATAEKATAFRQNTAFGENRISSLHGTAGTGNIPATAVHERPPDSGTAGKKQTVTGTSRFTHVSSEVSRHSGISSTVQNMEQKSAALNNGIPVSGDPSEPKRTTAESSRYSQRQAIAEPSNIRNGAVAAPETVSKWRREYRYHGTAGMEAATTIHRSSNEPRHGRNTADPSASASSKHEPKAFQTARQEKPSGSPEIHKSPTGQAPVMRHGTAGTAPNAIQFAMVGEKGRSAYTKRKTEGKKHGRK